MKRILILSLVALFVMGQAAYARFDIGSADNAVILGANMGPNGTTPITEVIKVSTGSNPSGKVGMVMVWDYTNAGDGYHVTECTQDMGGGATTVIPEIFAGVMVTTTSSDSDYSYTEASKDSYNTYTARMAGGPTCGYMAIRGIARASVDVSAAVAGQGLTLNGNTLPGSFATATGTLSQDIGVLLERTQGDDDTLYRVWLK